MYPSNVISQEKAFPINVSLQKKTYAKRNHKLWEGGKPLNPQLPDHLKATPDTLSWFLETSSPAHQRVAIALIKLADSSGEFQICHDYLAKASNLSVSHLKRILNDLRTKKLLDWRTYYKKPCLYKLAIELMLPKLLKKLSKPYTYYPPKAKKTRPKRQPIIKPLGVSISLLNSKIVIEKQVKNENELLNICTSFKSNIAKENNLYFLSKAAGNATTYDQVTSSKREKLNPVTAIMGYVTPFVRETLPKTFEDGASKPACLSKKAVSMNKQSIIDKYNFSPDQLERLEEITPAACHAAHKKMEWKRSKGKEINAPEALFMVIAKEENEKVASAPKTTQQREMPKPVYNVQQTCDSYTLQKLEELTHSAYKQVQNAERDAFLANELEHRKKCYDLYSAALELKKKDATPQPPAHLKPFSEVIANATPAERDWADVMYKFMPDKNKEELLLRRAQGDTDPKLYEPIITIIFDRWIKERK